MLQEPGPQLHFILVRRYRLIRRTITATMSTEKDKKVLGDTRQYRWEVSHQTASVFIICTVMFGNGLRIAGTTGITVHRETVVLGLCVDTATTG